MFKYTLQLKYQVSCPANGHITIDIKTKLNSIITSLCEAIKKLGAVSTSILSYIIEWSAN